MGKEFIELFEQWADTYDDSVTGADLEYKEVFHHYNQILEEVANRTIGNVIEFGPGTGNLTKKLVKKGLNVTAVEPSKAMRKLAVEKLKGQAVITDGDFFHFPLLKQIDTFVSTYAFHHLTDEEKEKAIISYGKLLQTGGKIVFADTVFATEEAYLQAVKEADAQGFSQLSADLQREYYTTIPILQSITEQNGFQVSFSRLNKFVWIMEAIKL
ncbi:class I SAM-dependent methyltransferase [Bacillaceae bacterium Marseille-Q3522]|nr:class I SAM-dependent methyltransferase [Bacillaceae bacterium Marseille-Q3522]